MEVYRIVDLSLIKIWLNNAQWTFRYIEFNLFDWHSIVRYEFVSEVLLGLCQQSTEGMPWFRFKYQKYHRFSVGMLTATGKICSVMLCMSKFDVLPCWARGGKKQVTLIITAFLFIPNTSFTRPRVMSLILSVCLRSFLSHADLFPVSVAVPASICSSYRRVMTQRSSFHLSCSFNNRPTHDVYCLWKRNLSLKPHTSFNELLLTSEIISSFWPIRSFRWCLF